jgi:hypothetical protein
MTSPKKKSKSTKAVKKKIAIVGTGSQWQLAPFNDPEWEIWGLIGVATNAPRLDRLYEFHERKIVEHIANTDYADGSYWKVAQSLGPNFITNGDHPECPQATQYDFQHNIEKYGKYWCSSVDWMIADAINLEPEAIGLFGINMASDSEYVHQKPSASFYLGIAKGKGIKVIVPSSSEVLAGPYMYGLEEMPRIFHGLMQRKAEYQYHLGEERKVLEASRANALKYEAYLEIVQWIEQNFCTGNAAYFNESKEKTP